MESKQTERGKGYSNFCLHFGLITRRIKLIFGRLLVFSVGIEVRSIWVTPNSVGTRKTFILIAEILQHVSVIKSRQLGFS